MKRVVQDIRYFAVDVPSNMPDHEIREGFNLGDIEGEEIDGRIEILEADSGYTELLR